MSSLDYLFNKRIKLYQPKNSFRTGLDSVLLSSLIPELHKGKILDMGCGVSSIGLCYCSRVNSSIKIVGIEKSLTYYEYSLKNIALNNMSFNMSVVHSDILDMPYPASMFDVVVTNPPYETIDSSLSSKSDLKNIANIESTVNLQQWILQALKVLKFGGIFCLVHKIDRLDDILSYLYGKVGDIKIIPIQTKKNKHAKRFLLSSRKGYKGGIKIHSFLKVYEKDNKDMLVYKILNGLSGYIEDDF